MKTSVLVALGILAAAPQFDALPVFNASEIVPAEIRQGPHYRVAEEIESDGYWNIYRIETDYGTFTAPGNTLLRIRVREIEAIAKLNEVNEAQVLGEAAVQSMEDVGTSLVTAATQPKETAQGIGSGVKRLFGRVGRTGRRVGERVQASSDEDKGGGGATTSSTAKKTGKAAGTVGKSLLGISKAERRWAQKLGVDPYSRNQMLRKELNHVASFEAAGRITTSVVVPIPMVVKLTTDVSDLVWKKDPDEIEKLNEDRLKEMKVSGEVSRDFRLNSHYTLTWQTLLVASLYALGNAPGVGDYVAHAAEARTEGEALFYTESAALLDTFHQEKGTVYEIIPGMNAIAKLGANRIAYLVPVDYMVWTEELQKFVDGEIEWLNDHYPEAVVEVWLTGESSPLVKKDLRARDWSIRDNAITITVE